MKFKNLITGIVYSEDPRNERMKCHLLKYVKVSVDAMIE